MGVFKILWLRKVFCAIHLCVAFVRKRVKLGVHSHSIGYLRVENVTDKF